MPSVNTQLFLPMETGADFVLPDSEGNGGLSGTHYGGVHGNPLCVDEMPKKKKISISGFLVHPLSFSASIYLTSFLF